MIPHTLTSKLLTLTLTMAVLAPFAAADLRNVNKGDPLPDYTLPTIDAQLLKSADTKGSVVVIVYLSAEQRSSELAAIESQNVTSQFDADTVKLIHVTADVVHKPYYERFRADKGITCPLALDASRSFYGDLGLIVFPTTIVVDTDGNLEHVISTRGPDYVNTLNAYVHHALGSISDDQLAEKLKAHPSDIRSPRSLASRHRAAARLLTEKGLYDAAKKELITAQELAPDDLDIQLDLADLCIKMSTPEQAQAIIDPILAENPDHRRAKFLKGVTLYRLDQLSESESILLEALLLNPDPARTHYYLGRIYERQGDTTTAIEHYKQAPARLLDEPE